MSKSSKKSMKKSSKKMIYHIDEFRITENGLFKFDTK